MEGYEIDECLESMQIIVDTREQPSERAEKRYSSFGVPYARNKLNYGDYTYNFRLNGKMLYQLNDPISPIVCIERKESLEELSGNLFQNRDRFEREFRRAKDQGAKIYLLIEDADWVKLMQGRYRTKANPKAFFSSLVAFMARYDIAPILCKKEISGKMIHQILYRELKERLVRGDYG